MRSLKSCLLLIILCSTAQAADYRNEVITHAIKPCYTDLVNRDAYEYEKLGMDTAQVAEFLIIMQTDTVEGVVRSMIPLVTGQDLANRMTIYKLGKEMCLKVADK